MATLVLDTNIVSYVMRGHTLAAAYRPLMEGHLLAISFMTQAELYEGAVRAGWGSGRMARLDQEVSRYIVIHSTDAVSRHWGAIRAERSRQPIAPDDAWIAATARAHGFPLVTHNAKDFTGISDLRVVTLSGG